MIKQILFISFLIAIAFSKPISQIKSCSIDTCKVDVEAQMIADKLSQKEIQSNVKEALDEDQKFEKCIQKEFNNQKSACYQFDLSSNKEITSQEFADCMNLCGSNYVNQYAVQHIKCTCQKCANEAKCSSQILMFVGLLITILIL